MPTAIVDTQTNEFVPSGHDEDARYVRLTFGRNPDYLREKWNGSTSTPGFTPKTQAEIDATVAAQQDAIAGAQWVRGLQAVAAALERNRTGSFPTPAQANTLKGYFITAWKSLGP